MSLEITIKSFLGLEELVHKSVKEEAAQENFNTVFSLLYIIFIFFRGLSTAAYLHFFFWYNVTGRDTKPYLELWEERRANLDQGY